MYLKKGCKFPENAKNSKCPVYWTELVCVCVRACACVCVRNACACVYVRVCVYVRGCMCGCMCVRVCGRAVSMYPIGRVCTDMRFRFLFVINCKSDS